jgi:hypothetical protein
MPKPRWPLQTNDVGYEADSEAAFELASGLRGAAKKLSGGSIAMAFFV